MEECARKSRVCAWTIVAQDDCLDANLTLLIKICREGVAGAPPLLDVTAPGFEFRIRSLPIEEQLKLFESFSEAFSEKKNWWQRFRETVSGVS